MRTLLRIDSSPSASSISRELTQEFAEAWKSVHPDGDVIHRDLTVAPAKPINAEWIAASYTPPQSRTAKQNEILASSDELINELERADEYVFGVAMHNFAIPSVLKLWIDQVVRAGRTFAYDENGAKGLLHGKKATVLIASGGVYQSGTPAASMNHIDPYLKTILSFVGVTDVTFVTAAGAARLTSGSIDRQTFLQPTLELVRAAAV